MSRAVRVLLLALPMVVVVFVGFLLVRAAGALSEASACVQPDDRFVDITIVLICVGAFFLGRLVVARRDQSADTLQRPRSAEETGARALLFANPTAARRGALITHLALALFFAGGVGALAYETVAVWGDNPWGFQSITFYVRCAKGTSWPLTLLVAATVSFFAGHWLWFPLTRRRR